MKGEGLGFHYEAERGEGNSVVCPDAWCDACHAALLAADDWSEDVVEGAGFKVVCSHCYSGIRARNWVQDDTAWQSLVASSVAYLQEQQSVLMRDFRLGEHQRWDWDQERGELTFSNDGKVAVVCGIVMTGSLSLVSGTWLWSWANESILEPLKEPLIELREFGAEREFEKVAGACWSGTEEDGWEMTAVAAKFLGALGAYRSPKEEGFTFMAITSARWVQ